MLQSSMAVIVSNKKGDYSKILAKPIMSHLSGTHSHTYSKAAYASALLRPPPAVRTTAQNTRSSVNNHTAHT